MSGQQKILVVDDERFNVNLLVDLLKHDYKVMIAKNGEQALKACQSDHQPDMVLLDIMMPGMDGYEVCRHLKADPRTSAIPVIFVSAMGAETDETKGLELGAVDYITKPISPPIVKARVRTHLALKSSMEELKGAYRIIESQKDRMQEELNVGRDIQMSLLPRVFPPFPDRKEFDLFALLEPAKEIGGDLYDFFMVDEHRLCFVVGDVSGKGVPAALFMAMTKIMLKTRAVSDPSPASIVTHANDAISADNDTCMFVTLYFGILNLRDGTLLTTNAGHNPPLLKRRGGQFEWLKGKDGQFAGPTPGIAYKETKTQLAPGDELFLYTDGVTEADNVRHELFGNGRLIAVLNQSKGSSVIDRVRDVMQAVETFAGDAPQADDITMLALRYNGVALTDVAPAVFRQTMPNQVTAIHGMQMAFGQYVTQWEGAKPLIPKLNIALDDLLSNIVQYAFPNDPTEHDITVEGEVRGEWVVLTITDDGIPFNPLTVETPDLALPLHEREIGGLGIHLVRSMFDEVSYHRTVGHNVITVKKKLPS